MDAAKLYGQIDVPRNVWDPTEVQRHSRYGERSYAEITGVEVHWVGTGAVGDHGDTETELLAFERYHEVTKGWYDLFYQVGIDTEGYTYEGRHATIPSQGSLRNWLTVLFVLGQDDPPPPTIMYNRLYDIWGAVSPDRRPETLRYHGERASTGCPGDDIELGVKLLRGGWNPYDTHGGNGDMEFKDLPQKPVPTGAAAELGAVAPAISDGKSPGALAARWEAILMSNRAYVESKKYVDQQIKKAIANIDPQPEVDVEDIVAQATERVLRSLDGSEVVISQQLKGVLDI